MLFPGCKSIQPESFDLAGRDRQASGRHRGFGRTAADGALERAAFTATATEPS